MPLPVNRQYAPPQSWEEFESLCADLYERIWKDPNTQRHGRQGQPQGGVDVYGQPDGKNYTGVQCKEKGIWPPTKLTKTDVNEEVKKAETWKPGLKHFIVATTAPNDKTIQAHARDLTKKHKKQGLFSVAVVSWDEIIRRLATYPELLSKYGYAPDITLDRKIEALPGETAKLVAEKLQPKGSPRQDVAQDAGVARALERDLAARFDRSMRRSFFPETIQVDEYDRVAEIAIEPQYETIAPALRRRIFLRASRSAAVRGSLERANDLLSRAQALASTDSDLLARARILERSGDIDGAISLIRDESDPDSRSTLFNILVRHRGFEAGLAWLGEEGIAVRDLTINGVQTLVFGYLQKNDFETLQLELNELTDSQLHDGPYFRFVRAMANVASLLPIPDREVALRSFMVDARRGTRSILDVTETASRLDLALSDLNALLPIAADLELREAKRLAETYIRWCELLHPHRKSAGLAKLHNDLKDIKAARTRLALAFAFDKDFNPKPLEDYLKRREELGGLDDDDLNTALIIRIHSDDPASVAALVARYRVRFEKNYQDPIFTIEIQALALAGDTVSARLLLEKHRADLTPDGVAGFEALIAKMEGKDPVSEDLKVYESTKTVGALRTLVMSLALKKDHRGTARYSEELYAKSSDPQDIARAAQAFAFLGDGTEFIRIIEAHPFLLDREPGLLHRYGWELFKKGRLRDAKSISERLATLGAAHRDLQLEIVIAVESGEWESLAKPLAAFLDDIPRHSGLTLIRAAHVAQQSGQGPLFDLVRAAISKADNDPHVWLGAYSIVIEEGREDDFPDSHFWLRKALVLSDKNGPVQQFELKELVPQQIEWDKRTRDISERVNRGEVPLVIAAPGLRTTVVDILLRNLVRNAELQDARRKYVIPLFSGHRRPWRCTEAIDRIGLDISSLLVLGWLGLLPKVFQTFKVVALPASVLAELFEGRRRVQQVQKSRIKRGRELEQAILRNHLAIARPVERADDPVSAEVGPSLAALIRTASDAGGIVLRPAPIHRPGLEQIPADVSGQLGHLSDMHALLRVLVEKGAISETVEETARKYFELQDKGLPGCAQPDPDKPLFIDGLALVYLQYTDLLDPVLKVFKDVRIEGSSEDEALAIIEYDQHIENVLTVIDDTRDQIRIANAAGKVSFGPRRADRDEVREDQMPSTLHALSDLAAVDAIVCDDRALNKENFAADNQGKRIPCLTSLDLFEEMRARGSMTEAEWMGARHKLRTGGAAIVPLNAAEVLHAAARSVMAISAEMRAIQESIDLARISEVPTFPREIQWFADTSLALKAAVLQIWKTQKDHALATRLSNLIMSTLPKPEDWASRWEAGPPPGWVENVSRVILASLAMPIEIGDVKIVAAYNEWFEQHQLEPLKSIWPKRYQAVVEQARSFIFNAEDDDDEKEKSAKPKKETKSKRKAKRPSKRKKRG